jgi:hypothetical protein
VSWLARRATRCTTVERLPIVGRRSAAAADDPARDGRPYRNLVVRVIGGIVELAAGYKLGSQADRLRLRSEGLRHAINGRLALDHIGLHDFGAKRHQAEHDPIVSGARPTRPADRSSSLSFLFCSVIASKWPATQRWSTDQRIWLKWLMFDPTKKMMTIARMIPTMSRNMRLLRGGRGFAFIRVQRMGWLEVPNHCAHAAASRLATPEL